jgi:hypothetical protein
MECQELKEWMPVVTALLAMLSLVSELMGVTTKGPNGIADSIRHMGACVLAWARQRRAESPRSVVDIE